MALLEDYDTDDAGILALRTVLCAERNRDPNFAKGITWETIKLIDDLKTKAITLAMKECGWNKTEAAKRLRINRTTLIDQLARLDIKESDPKTERVSERLINALFGTVSIEMIKAECAKATQDAMTGFLEEKLKANKAEANGLRELHEQFSDRPTGRNSV